MVVDKLEAIAYPQDRESAGEDSGVVREGLVIIDAVWTPRDDDAS